ncbi:MAG: alpha/beta hydrolase [Desulfobulbaceae bacterium]
MFDLLLSVLGLVGGLYVLLCIYLFCMQDRLLFYPNLPSREITATPTKIGLNFEPVTITTSDHVRIKGWFVPAPQAKGVLLFLHGNAGNISHRLDSLAIFHRLGLSTLIIDYRGYGESEGRISEQGTYLDAQAAWRYLTETRGVAPEEIIIFGRSLGGAVAAHLAARTSPAGLILESVFSSVPDMAAQLYPVFPVRLLARYQYDVKKAVRTITCPLLVIHSPDDEIIPFAQGVKVYEAAGAPKEFLEIRGSHNEGFMESGSMYQEGLERFILSCLAGKGR